MDASQISFGVAFLAGLASFLSPCVLPLVPMYLAQLVGQSVSQSAGGQQEQTPRLTTFLHALMFVLGFTLAFVALGATASTLGSFLRAYQLLLRHIGGIVLVIFGLHLTGILRLPIFYWQKRFAFRPSRPSLSRPVESRADLELATLVKRTPKNKIHECRRGNADETAPGSGDPNADEQT